MTPSLQLDFRSIILSISTIAVGFFSPFALANITVSIGESGGQDDYICWGRVPVEISWESEDVAPPKVTISSKQLGDESKGRIAFSNSRQQNDILTGILETPIDPVTKKGHFYVAGTSASASGKDVVITVASSAQPNGELGNLPIMVRVRKNADTLSEIERDQFLDAFQKAAAKNNQFAKYWGIHTDAVRMAHQVAFLPWHRVFLLQLERELQEQNPAVALPYWKFDSPAKKLFTTEFLGSVGNLPNPLEVEFSENNPLSKFRLSDPRVTPLTRRRNGDTVSTSINKNFFREQDHGIMTSEIFGSYHGQAHIHIGGLVGDINRSPADPLFFMLHANVDRAWAAWQRYHDRFDKNDVRAYGLQGSHSAGARFLNGNFVEDTMWPWDNELRPTQPVNITIGQISLPSKTGAASGLNSNPQVGDLIDYLNLNANEETHNYCYDTVPSGVGTVIDFP